MTEKKRTGIKPRDPLIRFMEKTRETEQGCWQWTGCIYKATGYGDFRVPGVKETAAHRWAYLLLVGPIPEGLEIDHLCRKRDCVNPAHLEPVTRRTNVMRGAGPAKLAAMNTSKTHCLHGHPFDEANTRRDHRGHRVCRACMRRHSLAQYYKKKQEAKPR